MVTQEIASHISHIISSSYQLGVCAALYRIIFVVKENHNSCFERDLRSNEHAVMIFMVTTIYELSLLSRRVRPCLATFYICLISFPIISLPLLCPLHDEYIENYLMVWSRHHPLRLNGTDGKVTIDCFGWWRNISLAIDSLAIVT